MSGDEVRASGQFVSPPPARFARDLPPPGEVKREVKRAVRRGEKWQRQSSGSTFTKAWAWFEPTQNDTGVVEFST